MIPVARPQLPPVRTIAAKLQGIDERRVYSNFGPLERRFAAAIGERVGLGAGSITTVGNATIGLTAALRAIAGHTSGICVLPSWTFCASAHAVLLAGLKPHFVDVDEASWQISPQSVRDLLAAGHDVGAVMPVAPFGSPVDVTAWDAFSDETGVPVVIDAAAGFGNQHVGRSPVVFSFHATKMLAIGEGGAVASRDVALGREIQRAINFGFHGDRVARIPAINGKLSEYAAAIGLCALDSWPETQARWADRARCYGDNIARAGISLPGPDAPTSTFCRAMPCSADRMAARLRAGGIETRRWWGMGCHSEPAFCDFPRSKLAATQTLARQVLGLPMFLDLPDAAIKEIVDAVAAVLAGEPEAS